MLDFWMGSIPSSTRLALSWSKLIELRSSFELCAPAVDWAMAARSSMSYQRAMRERGGVKEAAERTHVAQAGTTSDTAGKDTRMNLEDGCELDVQKDRKSKLAQESRTTRGTHTPEALYGSLHIQLAPTGRGGSWCEILYGVKAMAPS